MYNCVYTYTCAEDLSVTASRMPESDYVKGGVKID
jgi:hypothetical protein